MTSRRRHVTAPARRRARRSDLLATWRRRLPLLPALLFTILVTQIPFVMSIWYSLTDLEDRDPSPTPAAEFVGLENYTNAASTTSSSATRCGRASR